jgi:hypothetical protein
MILTTKEYNCAVDELLKLFACSEEDQMEFEIWRVRRGIGRRMADVIWLFVFAINTWEHEDGAVNYMTEEQMMAILSKANTFFR